MARQAEIPGTETKKIKELNEAAEAHRKQAKRLVSARKKMGEFNELIQQLMQKHGLEIYTDATHVPPLTIRLKQGKIKVVVEEQGGDGESDDQDADQE